MRTDSCTSSLVLINVTPYKPLFSEAVKLSTHDIAFDLIDFCGGDPSEFEAALDNRGFLRKYGPEEKQFIEKNKSVILQTALEYSDEGEVE